MSAETTPSLRILLLADSHLGFDLPVRPRTERRRRGHDFLANYHRALEPAPTGDVDVAADVIRHRDIPRELAAVFTGHIHRHQVLGVDLEGRRLATPVLYPGSIERTAFAEADETKGFMLVRLALDDSPRNDIEWEFRPLPARPMLRVDLVATAAIETLSLAVREAIANTPDDAVLSLRVHGELTRAHWHALSAKSLRAVAPPTMNVEVVPLDQRARATGRPRVRALSPAPQSSAETQLALL